MAGGDSLLSPAATKGLIKRFLDQPVAATMPAAPELAELTNREREVLSLVARGLSNEEIAKNLSLSPLTGVRRATGGAGRHGLSPPRPVQ